MIAFIMLVAPSLAQSKFSVLRYDDDISSLKEQSFKSGLDLLKFIPLGNDFNISIGGELREQYQAYKNINFGDSPKNIGDKSPHQLRHRFMAHANLDLGNHLRFFIQLSNTLRFLNTNPVAPEVDENQLSLHQFFAEVKANQWKFRLGAQELLYGNNRLITVREGQNTRLTFDGIVVKRVVKNGSIDILAVSKVISRQFIFDDKRFKEWLVGFYGTQYCLSHKIGLDYFIVNLQSRSRKYNYQSGFENRQTYGIRLFSNLRKINFEVEGEYQSGKFNNLNVNAYSIFSDLNITLLSKNKGIIGFATNFASGDNNRSDNKLNTYNSMYAKPAFGLAIPLGATNIVSLAPYFRINLIHKLNILAQVFFLARSSSQDGTYSPAMIQNRPRPDLLFGSIKRTLGELYVIETNYQQTKNLSFAFDYSFFKAGSYPKATGIGKDISYISFKSAFKF
jgi:hypothetical protein